MLGSDTCQSYILITSHRIIINTVVGSFQELFFEPQEIRPSPCKRILSECQALKRTTGVKIYNIIWANKIRGEGEGNVDRIRRWQHHKKEKARQKHFQGDWDVLDPPEVFRSSKNFLPLVEQHDWLNRMSAWRFRTELRSNHHLLRRYLPLHQICLYKSDMFSLLCALVIFRLSADLGIRYPSNNHIVRMCMKNTPSRQKAASPDHIHLLWPCKTPSFCDEEISTDHSKKVLLVNRIAQRKKSQRPAWSGMLAESESLIGVGSVIHIRGRVYEIKFSVIKDNLRTSEYRWRGLQYRARPSRRNSLRWRQSKWRWSRYIELGAILRPQNPEEREDWTSQDCQTVLVAVDATLLGKSSRSRSLESDSARQ